MNPLACIATAFAAIIAAGTAAAWIHDRLASALERRPARARRARRRAVRTRTAAVLYLGGTVGGR